MGGCPNYGSFLDTLNIRCRIIIGIKKGIRILTTHMGHIFTYMSIYMSEFDRDFKHWVPITRKAATWGIREALRAMAFPE